MTTLPSRHFPFRASLLCLLISLGTSSALGTVSTLKPARVLNGPLMPVQETVFVQNQLVVLQDQDVIVAPGVSIRLQGNFFRLVADPVHPRVVVVGERLSVLETEKGRLLYTLGHSVTSYRTAAFSPDGHTLAALVRPEGRELVLEVWDLETGTRTAALPIAPEEEEVLSLAFTPDGRSVLTVGKAVRSWSLEKVGQSSLLARSKDLPWTRAVVSPEAVWVVSIGGGLTYLPLEAGRSVPPALADLTRNSGVVSVWRDAKSGLLAFGEKGGRIIVFDPLS